MSSRDPHLGSVIAERYHPEQHIGTGLLGRTYLASDLQQDQAPVALKILEAGRNGRPDFSCLREDLLQLSDVRHPNLVRLLDFGVLDDGRTPYLVREFAEGMEVNRAITPREVEHVLDVVARICHVLQFLHSRGVLHGNLKATNVFVARNNGQGEQVKLSDYGLGRCVSGWGEERRSAHISWLAPEVLMGHPGSVQSDLYSLGVLAYLLLAGRLPFEDEDEGYLIQKSLQGRPDARPIEKLESGPGLAHMLRTMLAKNPGNRPTSAEEVLRLLGVARARDFIGIIPEETGSYFTRGKFVGREREMMLFEERAAGVRESGRGAGLFLGGEAGSGKTRCLEEFRIRALLSGWRVFEASCQPNEDCSYGPFRRFLQATDRIYAHQAGHQGAPEIFSQDHRSGASEFDPQVLATESVAGRFRDAITCEVVRRLCGRPTVFMLHDFHWADEATCAVLGYLISDIVLHPVFVCVGYRTGDESRMWLSRTIESLERQARAERVLLEGLSSKAVSELVLSMTLDRQFSDAISAWVCRTSGGNPFFIEEILKQLLESGLIGRVLGRWTLKSGGLEGAAVPSSIMAVLEGRVAQLASPARGIAQWMAVCGRSVPQSVLHRLTKQPAEAFGEGLRELAQRQLVRLGTGQEEPEVDFRHSLIAEVIRNSIGANRRRRMHRLVGEFIEGQPDKAARVNELALHFTEGRGGEKALRYALEAARGCKAEFANDRALHFLEYVRLHGRSLPVEVRCEAALEAADACCILGSPHRALRLLKSLPKLSGELGRIHSGPHYYLSMSRAHQFTGNLELSREDALKGLAELSSKRSEGLSGDSIESRLLAQLAFCMLAYSETGEGLALIERALLVSEEPLVDGHLNILLGGMHWVACDFGQGYRASLVAINILQPIRACHLLPMAYSHAGVNLAGRGKFAQAIKYHQLSVDAVPHTRSAFLHAQALCNLAEALGKSGSFSKSFEILRDLHELAFATGNAGLIWSSRICRAEISIATGKYNEAADDLLSLDEKTYSLMPVYLRAQTLYCMAWLNVELGNFVQAKEALSRLDDSSSKVGRLYENLLGDVLRARICLSEGCHTEAEGLLEEVERVSSQAHLAYQNCVARLHHASLLLPKGEQCAALRLGKRALSLARAMSARQLEAHAHLLLGQILDSLRTSEVFEGSGRNSVNSLSSEDLTKTCLCELKAAAELAEECNLYDVAWKSHLGLAKLADTNRDDVELAAHARRALESIDRMLQGVPESCVANYVRINKIDEARANACHMLQRSQQLMQEDLSYLKEINECHLRSLLRFSTVINGCHELQALLEAIEDLFARSTGMARAFIILSHRETGLKTKRVGYATLSHGTAKNDTLETISREVYRSCSPFVTGDAFSDPRPICRNVSDVQQTAILCVPLRAHGKTLGVIYADGPKYSEELSDSFINYLATFSNLAAIAVEGAQVHEGLRYEKEILERNIQLIRGGSEELIGKSAIMELLVERIATAATSPLDVLIYGESGTGKEVVARTLHRRSKRAGGNFIAVDCGSLSDSLAESELFGYRKGAFTGAQENRPGLFEAANGGVIFLDEIGNLPGRLQRKLLRVLQEREVRRIGETTPRKLDIQVLAATNRNLRMEIQRGRFREDLYYRLNVMQIHVPPLRERDGDVVLLLDYYLVRTAHLAGGQLKRFSDEASKLLTWYMYPGNVRELKHIVESAYYVTKDMLITCDDLPVECRNIAKGIVPFSTVDGRAMALWRQIVEGNGNFYDLVKTPLLKHDIDREVVRQIIRRALATTNGRYRDALDLLRVRKNDYSVVLQFLRRHECYLDFRTFR